ncbi:MAG: sigma-54 dependent transcriptional regulator [candidate division Zixibacteria bacterium]|nr:sigma-54 dependent transcriptional regulator [candidate division Zixibacteria bacterium]
MLEKRVLVVDDDNLTKDFLSETLSRSNYLVELASSGDEALDKLKQKEYDVVVSDIRMPKLSGMELLKAAKESCPDTKIIMMTAFGTVENAVEAMKLGAFDYIMKPFSADEIELIVKKAFEYKKLLIENRMLKTEVAGKYRFQNIIGKSPQMQKIFEMVDMIADSRSSVLLSGESGTGKELIAKAIHYNSSRKEGPFIKINCAALPEGLVESELFGHEKGAFTGAIRQTRGRFEMADGGTLLLDEISEITPGLQAKLLRVLQEREFERVGSGYSIQVDVRIISTSNKNLEEQIKQEKFREDLFFRLNVIPIHLAPLQVRKEDIPLLAEHFLQRYNQENKKNVQGISEKVYQLFLEYHWPGNVRELENYIERAVVTTKNKILMPSDFPPELFLKKAEYDDSGLKVGCTIADMEKALILKTLEIYGKNKTKAAEVLGISSRTLRNKLQEYGLKEEKEQGAGSL